MVDPLIAALFAKIPPPETMWRMQDRALWLNAVAHAFSMVYRAEQASLDGEPLVKAIVMVDLLAVPSLSEPATLLKPAQRLPQSSP